MVGAGCHRDYHAGVAMMHRYILDEKGEPVPCEDLMEWARWMEANDRTVWKTTLDDGRIVSTVFLGIDHAWPLDGDVAKHAPVLFETMIFPKDSFDEQYCDRYCTREEAKAGHVRAIMSVQGPTVVAGGAA